MQPFRATLIDDDSHAIADVEGSIQSPDETDGPRRGKFELQEDQSLMQGILDQKTYHLQLEDGSELTIRVDSAATTSKPGYSLVEFSCKGV
jgi:hypothetical protein